MSAYKSVHLQRQNSETSYLYIEAVGKKCPCSQHPSFGCIRIRLETCPSFWHQPVLIWKLCSNCCSHSCCISGMFQIRLSCMDGIRLISSVNCHKQVTGIQTCDLSLALPMFYPLGYQLHTHLLPFTVNKSELWHTPLPAGTSFLNYRTLVLRVYQIDFKCILRLAK